MKEEERMTKEKKVGQCERRSQGERTVKEGSVRPSGMEVVKLGQKGRNVLHQYTDMNFVNKETCLFTYKRFITVLNLNEQAKTFT